MIPLDVQLSDLGERALLEHIRRRVPRPATDVLTGIGDDAAVVAPRGSDRTVLTTDALVEGVHFDRRWSSPADIGHKALAVNLSDIAAMGATPRWVLLSLVVPADWTRDAIDALLDGFLALAAREHVTLVGGNVARASGGLVVDVTAVGTVRPRRTLLRSTARPGDDVYVTGTIGGARAGLEMLEAGADEADADVTACIARHRRPEARVAFGRRLAGARAARAAMDTSDGLADALAQIAAESGCGVRVDAERLPIEAGAERWWTRTGRDPVVAALAGGEDYELLFTAPRSWAGRLRHVRRQVARPAVTKIGTVTRDRARVLVRDGREDSLPAGYQHFGPE